MRSQAFTNEIDFETICEKWKNLWPDTKHRQMSSMLYKGGIDMEIYKKYTPTFFGHFIGEQLVGVNSGHRTSDTMYRSRGIWIDKSHRGLGVSTALFNITQQVARQEGCTMLWSIPRESAYKSYYRFGFRRTSEYFSEGMDYGPNCYVVKYI